MAGADVEGHDLYQLTDTGRQELSQWWATPLGRESRPRDELTIKLALAVTVPGVDIRSVVQTQRADTMRALQDYTRLKIAADERVPPDLAWVLVLESMIFQAGVGNPLARPLRVTPRSPARSSRPPSTDNEPAKRGRR